MVMLSPPSNVHDGVMLGLSTLNSYVASTTSLLIQPSLTAMALTVVFFVMFILLPLAIVVPVVEVVGLEPSVV